MQNKSITQKSHSVLSARKTFIFSSHFYAAINSTQPANKGWNQMTNIFNNLQLDWVMPRCLLSSGSARRWESGWWRSTTRRRGHFNDNFTPTTRPTAPFFSKLLCLWKGVDRGGLNICIVGLLPSPRSSPGSVPEWPTDGRTVGSPTRRQFTPPSSSYPGVVPDSANLPLMTCSETVIGGLFDGLHE